MNSIFLKIKFLSVTIFVKVPNEVLTFCRFLSCQSYNIKRIKMVDVITLLLIVNIIQFY